MKPTSPLPWPGIGIPTALRPTFTLFHKPFGLGDVAEVYEEQDAEFIKHACNAYPKLVEALKEANNAIGFVANRIGDERMLPLVQKHARLIQELGEL